MMVDGSVISVARAPERKRLSGPLCGYLGLKGIKLRLIAETESIDEDGCSRIAVWVGLNPIHAPRRQTLRWATTIARMRCSGDSFLRSKSAARCFIRRVNAMPST